MRSKIVFIAAIVCLFSACNPSEKQGNNADLIHIELDPNNMPPLGKLSDVVESVRIIPLETSENIMIPDVGRSFIGKEYIVFMSRGGTNYLYLFTKEGRFIRKLGRRGKGPGEYIQIRGISVLEEEKVVYIVDAFNRPFLGYSFSGELANSFEPPLYEHQMEAIDLNTFAATTVSGHEVLIINTQSNDTLKYFPIDRETMSWMPQFSGSQHSGIFFFASGRDTIYQVNNNGLKPVLAFDFGEGHISGREISQKFGPEFPAGKIFIPFGVYNCGDYYHVHLQHSLRQGRPEYHSLFINRKSQEMNYMPVFEDADDILFCSNLFFEAASPEGELMTALPAIDLIEALPKILQNKDFKYSEKLISQIRNLKEEDNHVIVLFKLSENHK